MKRINKYNDIKPYETKDRSEIRELIHPEQHINTNQSVAEARVKPGGKTRAHHHETSEEIYLTTGGSGKLYIQKDREGEGAEIELQQGVSVVILPGETHWLTNTGQDELVILCCCSPPYSHKDTILD